MSDGIAANVTNLAAYTNTNYNPGSTLKRTLWYLTNILFFKTMLPFPSSMKVTTLKLLVTGIAIFPVIANTSLILIDNYIGRLLRFARSDGLGVIARSVATRQSMREAFNG
jgi:hypothetical protein